MIHRLRQSAQVVSLALFLYLFWRAFSPGLNFSGSDLFYRLDPLAAIMAMLAGRVWIPGLALAGVTLAFTLVFGRVWCGWVLLYLAGIALCIFLLLGGCSAAGQTVAPVVPTAAAATDMPQLTPEPTKTSSPTPLPTHTFTPTPEPPIVQNCISIQPELPADHTCRENLLLVDAAYGSLELYNLQSSKSVILS